MRKIKTEDHLTYLKVPVWNFSRVIHPFSKNRLYLKMPFFKFRKMRKKAKIAFWWAFRALEKIWFGLCNIKFKDMAWHMTTIKLCETLKSFFCRSELKFYLNCIYMPHSDLLNWSSNMYRYFPSREHRTRVLTQETHSKIW